MKLLVLGMLISSTFCGCTMFNNESSQNAHLSMTSSSDTLTPLESSLMFKHHFQNKLDKNPSAEDTSKARPYNSINTQYFDAIQHSKQELEGKLNINHYTKGLVQDLVANLQNVNSTTPLAVVSFVMLDSDYNQSSLLGNQIAESLIHEIHKFGIPVIDYKATGFVRVTEQGDFAFSKDYEELGDSLAARYIVGGTMTKHKDGYLVNARIVGLESKAVAASAQNFIPNKIADALITSSQKEAASTSRLQKLEEKDKAMIHDSANTISLVGS